MKPLPVSVDIVVAGIGLGFGWLHGRTLFRSGVRLGSRDLLPKARMFALAGLAFAVVNVAYLAVRGVPAVEWFIPTGISYYDAVGTWLSNLLIITFFAGATIAVAFLERHRGRWVVFSAVAIGLVCGVISYRVYARPKPCTLPAARVTAEGVILQTTPVSCSAAACANIAQLYGIHKTEQEMAEILGTTDQGTMIAGKIYGMESLGFRCVKRYIRDLDAKRLHAPALLFVDSVGGPDGHTVAYMGNDGITLDIWDPLFGKSRWGEGELREIWRGRAIEIWR